MTLVLLIQFPYYFVCFLNYLTLKRNITPIFAILLLFASCKNGSSKIVDKIFTDSLIAHYSYPAAVKTTEDELAFWKSQMNPASPGLAHEPRYASFLISRYHQFGDIQDIKKADSIMLLVNAAFNGKEASPNLTLSAYSILQHRFTEADNYLDQARKDGLKKYEALTASFDVDFELGRYANIASQIQQMKPYADYGYYFRKSKLDHLNGAIDSSVDAMLKAASLAETSLYLKDVALANAADLYIHAGKLSNAYALYKSCIKMNAVDFHSITGIGWIALVNDKNDSLAQQLFEFVQTSTKLPDPLFKLYQVAQQRKDSTASVNYARKFVNQATDTVYGNMYNKYLIELYTGILHEPAKAVALAKKELSNRNTAQTQAWYAWTLFANHKNEEAYKVFEQSVSGKPLEGLELYWMGKLMQGLDKGYNAQEFFKAAYKNKYDLSPAMMADLETTIGF